MAMEGVEDDADEEMIRFALGQRPGAFSGVDWTRTRAYALGNGLIYLNRQDREALGIVADDEIDGVLDDPVWTRAAPWTRLYQYGQFGRRLDSVRAFIAWDAANLYFAISVRDRDIFVASTERDAILCRADVGELFIKPRPDRPDYYEFQFNVRKAICDAYYPRNRAGGLLSGAVEAASAEAVASELMDAGIIPVQISRDSRVTDWRDALPARWTGRRVTLDDLIIFSRQMYTLARSGIPIIRVATDLPGAVAKIA